MQNEIERNISSNIFSETVQSLPQALSVYINQLLYKMRAKGREVTALSLGEAFYSIPKFDFGAIDFDRGYHYSDSQGLPELRKKIAGYYQDSYGVIIEWERQILISAGSKIVLFMCMKALLNPGEKIVVHEPAWLSYSEQARLCGAETIFIPYDAPVSEFFSELDRDARILIINNPNNPAGRVYTKEELTYIYQECLVRNMTLFVDEAYSDYTTSGDFTSIGYIAPQLKNLVIVNSLSKNMGMSGWRIGYMIANEEMIKQVLKVNQHLITCAPTILQLYLTEYFEQIIETTKPQIASITKKRAEVGRMMDDLRVKSLPGNATFYFFIDLESVGFTGDAMTLALHLILNHDISAVPGGAYGNSTQNFLRISIGTEPIEKIYQALLVLVEEAKKDLNREALDQELIRLNLPFFTEE